MARFGLEDTLTQNKNLILTEPLGYLEFIQLMTHSKAILTDSGGIQEETTYLGIPCLTFRDSTERPITVTLGTNQLLADLNPKITFAALEEILAGHHKKAKSLPYGMEMRQKELLKTYSTYFQNNGFRRVDRLCFWKNYWLSKKGLIFPIPNQYTFTKELAHLIESKK